MQGRSRFRFRYRGVMKLFAGPPYVVPTVTVTQRDGTLVTQRDAQQVYLRIL